MRLALRRRVHAVIGVVAAVLVAGACSTGSAGEVVKAAAKEESAHSAPPAPGSATNSPPPTASTPDAVPMPSDDEALRIVRTVADVPAKPDGTLDDAEAARRFAEPVLSLVRASWRITKPEYRLSGQLVPGFTVHNVWRPPASPGGDRWFAVTGTDAYTGSRAASGVGDDAEQKLLLFRYTAGDATWKLAFMTHMWEGTSFPEIAAAPDGTAQTVSSNAALLADPARVCAQLSAGQDTASWGPHANYIKGLESTVTTLNQRLGIITTFSGAERSDAVGPVWRAADGGALVPCVQQTRMVHEAGAIAMAGDGYSRYLQNTPGLRIRSKVETQIAMVLIHIPASPPTAKPDVSATVTYPLDWTFVPYGG